MKKENQFDERQLQIRGNIFQRGFIAAIAALLLNAFLQNFGIVWADGFEQNLLMVTLIITLVSVEFHIHGVYFGKGFRRGAFIAVFGLFSIILMALSCAHFLQGEKFFENGAMTTNGVHTIVAAMYLLSAIFGFIQMLRDKRDT